MAASESHPVQLTEPSAARRLARATILSKEGILFIILVLTVLVLSAASENFRRPENLLNQVRLVAEIGLMALPMTYIIITGGIDLSVASTFGMSAIVMGFLWQDNGWPLEIGLFVCLAVGLFAGFVNGWFIVRVGVPPLIMTLATLALFRGIALGVSQARSARGLPQWFGQVGQGQTLGVPTQVWVLLVAAIIAHIVLSRTTFGRGLYAIGNNELGARFAGVPVNRIKLAIYTFSGFMAALAGYIFTSRISTTRADMGTGLELDVIAGVVLGGTNIMGGSGSIVGSMIGIMLIQLVKNGLLLAGVKGDATIVVVGIVLILAILLNNFIQNRLNSSG